jgi:hypothetical protein
VITDRLVAKIAVRPGEQLHYLTSSTRLIRQASLRGKLDRLLTLFG